MAILERLLFLETEMETVAHHIGANPDSGFGNLRKTFKESLSIRFESLFILGGREQLLPIFGNPDEPPWPSKEELTGLRSEKIVLSCRNTQDGPSQVFMMHLIDVEHPDHGILVGRIRANYLWGIGDMNTLPAMSELSVFDESEKILLSSIPLPQGFRTNLVNKVNDSKERRFQWSYEGEVYFASSWTIFLKTRYFSPSWTVILSRAKNHVLAPTASYKQLFPLVMLLSLLTVVLLSAIQIRRHLVPLEKLKESTQLIGQGLFDTSVTISSGDEFEDLGDSFNKMSEQLGKQFQALSTMGQIDRAVLATLEKEKIIETLLSKIGYVCSHNNVEVGIVSNRAENKFLFFSKARQDGNIEHGSNRTISDEELDTLYNNRHYLHFNTIDLVETVRNYHVGLLQ
ncbi:MAG: HAMP domain-containing protein [Deltaproteobacteria bacterium]|nr:HAMP domain-containing protein [Deltaproteobacteria bacterium]